jgi:cell division protein FtsI/penicillin-binding protein 2
VILKRVSLVAVLRPTVSVLLSLISCVFVSCPCFSKSQKSESPYLLLQRAADSSFDGAAGAIVVVGVEWGEILASKNLELASRQLTRPGSTLKPFVLMALLDSGKLDPKQRFLCKRPLRIGGLRLDCSHTTDVTLLDADEAIAYSCNSYVAEASLRLNDGELVQALRRVGFDSLTGFTKNESAGHIDRPATQAQLQLTALGARGIEVTPVELLAAYRKRALRKRSRDASPYQPIWEGLEHAVAYGAAHAAYVEGMTVAGKTGTEASPSGARTHGIFVGYAPADEPEIAIVVYVPQGRGLDAVAIAQSVLKEYSQSKKKP